MKMKSTLRRGLFVFVAGLCAACSNWGQKGDAASLALPRRSARIASMEEDQPNRRTLRLFRITVSRREGGEF